MGSFGQSVSIIAYNVNRSGGAGAAVLLSWAHAVQAAERRTGGAGAGRRAGFGSLLRASRVTRPLSPIFLPCISIWFYSVCIRSGWFAGVGMGAIGM